MMSCHSRYLTTHVLDRYSSKTEDAIEKIDTNDTNDTKNDTNDTKNDDDSHQLLGVCAAFLPYYSSDEDTFLGVFDRLSLRTDSVVVRENSRLQFSALDFAVGRAVDALSKDIRSEAATIKYLSRLALLKSHVKDLRLSTRIRLQGVVYSLTQPGGPRYASKPVNRLAFRALDELFPHGKRTRRAINFGFRGLFVFSKVTGGIYYAYV